MELKGFGCFVSSVIFGCREGREDTKIGEMMEGAARGGVE